MALYKNRTNYKNHNINNTTCSLDGAHVAEGVRMISVERDNDEVEIFTVDDGQGVFVENPVTSGKITLQILTASPTNTWLWEKRAENSAFSVEITDSVETALNCSAQKIRVQKPPTIERSKDHQVVEWILTAVYLDVNGGGYSLEAA